MVMGIDPGKTGGIAVLSTKDGLWIEPVPLCEKEIDLIELSRLIKGWAGSVERAYLELVHSMPKQGVASTFTFGRGYGAVEGVLACCGIPTVRVRPQLWMKEIYSDCPQGKEAKERSLWAFNNIFPGVDCIAPGGRKPHMGMVDAALIAEFGRRTML